MFLQTACAVFESIMTVEEDRNNRLPSITDDMFHPRLDQSCGNPFTKVATIKIATPSAA